MSTILYSDDTHQCIKFGDLSPEAEVQSNQFLVVHNKRGMLIDCGGYRIYKDLLGEMARYLPAGSLDYIFLSHQDPDIGSGLNLWLPVCKAQILVSSLWIRFIPAFCVRGLSDDRVMSLPDNGMVFELGGSPLVAVPAHFMHSPGNFHLYDPVSKILFSGDLGASLGSETENIISVDAFAQHIQYMSGFHNRYMPSRKACRQWVEMVRQLDVAMVVPQHGARFSGPEVVARFYDWIENEPTAVDDNTDGLYRLPEGVPGRI